MQSESPHPTLIGIEEADAAGRWVCEQLAVPVRSGVGMPVWFSPEPN